MPFQKHQSYHCCQWREIGVADPYRCSYWRHKRQCIVTVEVKWREQCDVQKQETKVGAAGHSSKNGAVVDSTAKL